MKENIFIPWRRIMLGSIISVLFIFVLGFIDAILCSYYVISFEMAKNLMFAAVFIGAFIGNFIVTYREKSIIYTIISSFITFFLLNLMGLLTANKFNAKYTIWILIILCISAILSSVIKVLFK